MVGQVRGVNRAQLGAALRALRQASGKEAKAVARGALMSPSKLSKIENAKLAPSATDVERILLAIGVSPEIKA
jgi:transcriptional regulator with XRE-family HTH domain